MIIKRIRIIYQVLNLQFSFIGHGEFKVTGTQIIVCIPGRNLNQMGTHLQVIQLIINGPVFIVINIGFIKFCEIKYFIIQPGSNTFIQAVTGSADPVFIGKSNHQNWIRSGQVSLVVGSVIKK